MKAIKRPLGKLALSRTTVVSLSASDLEKAGGANTTDPYRSCDTDCIYCPQFIKTSKLRVL